MHLFLAHVDARPQLLKFKKKTKKMHARQRTSWARQVTKPYTLNPKPTANELGETSLHLAAISERFRV
jgi:hypothetical protein